MSRNGVNEDEEAQYGGHKVQPFSTPMQELEKHETETKAKSKTFKEIVGLEDFFSLNIWRASVSEVLGTAILVFMLDTIVISTFEAEIAAPNLVMSILVAFIVAILVRTGMPVSGGHINPVVTFSAALVGLISISRAIMYIVAQCLGGVLGALALKAVVSSKIEQTFSLAGCTVNVIAPGPNGPVTIGLETGQALWMEIIGTFVFLYASIWIAFDAKQFKALGSVLVCSIVGIVIGLIVFVSTTVTTKTGYGGVGINPARCLGPAIVRGGHLWEGHWIFWVGPTIGCVAFALYVKIIPK